MTLPLLSNLLIVLIALEHLGFLTIEMFLWTKPLGHKTFKMTPEVAKTSFFVAKNQGLYNGFLAAGLLWSIITQDPAQALSLKTPSLPGYRLVRSEKIL